MPELSLVADRESLLSALSRASKIGAQSALLLANGTLEVHAIGNHASMLARPSVDVDKPGAAALTVGPLESLMRCASDEKIRIDQKATQLRVRGARFDHVFATWDADKAPKFDESRGTSQVSAEPEAVATALRRILFACSEALMTGSVAIQDDGRAGIVLATFDGRKMAKQSVATSDGKLKAEYLLPRKSAVAIQSLLAGAKSLFLSFSENWIGADIDGCLFRFQQAEGRFSKLWRDGIGGLKKTAKFQMSAGPFQHALSQAAIALDNNADTRRMDFVGHGGTLNLSCKSTSISGGVELPIEDCDFKAFFDYRYVLDAIKGFDPEQALSLSVCEGGELLIDDDAGFLGLIAGLTDKD